MREEFTAWVKWMGVLAVVKESPLESVDGYPRSHGVKIRASFAGATCFRIIDLRDIEPGDRQSAIDSECWRIASALCEKLGYGDPGILSHRTDADAVFRLLAGHLRYSDWSVPL